MGGHYGSIHIRTDDAKAVRVALEELSREQETRFLLAPLIDGWVAAFPSDHGQDFGVVEALARKISAPILHCLVHDDDVFAYQFHNDGKLVDSYNSCPDYFGGEPEPRGGDVDLLRSILPDSAKRNELKRLLDAERFDFEMERMLKFSALLNLTNAVSAYDYLQDGERDGIKKWKQFIHIPDLTAERAAKRVAKAKAAAEMKHMAKSGLLVLELVGQKTSHSLFHTSPIWCIHPSSSEIFLAWAGSPVSDASPTRVSRIDPRTGLAKATDVEVSSHVHCMAVSSTGVWLAVGCASGDWKTQVFELANGQLLTEIPQSRAVGQVCFSNDGQTLFSLSEGTITVADLSKSGSITSIVLPGAARTMVLHPAGEHIVAECQGMLVIVHLPTWTVIKTLWIPEPPGPKRDLLEQVIAGGIAQRFLSEIEGHLPKDEIDQTRVQMSRHFLPKQGVFSLSFGSLGNYLLCGTVSGLCVLAWEKVLAASDMTSIDPLAFVAAEPLVRDDGTQDNQLIYAVPVDSVKRRILFAGLEGKARFVNISDGRIDDLLAPPIRRPFWRLELTPNRLALVGSAIAKPQRNKREPSCFQIWNYKALCTAAGLDW